VKCYTAFGDRVVLKAIEEKFDTEILLPQTRNIRHMLGKSVAISPNAGKAGFEVGAIYFFQVAMDPRTGAPLVPVHGGGDDQVIVQHWRDLIAKLSRDVVSLETFNVVGQWILLEPEAEQGLIVRPDNQPLDPAEVNFKVVQLGQPFEGLSVGDSVIVEKGRCNPIELKRDGKSNQYFYVDRQFVYGVISNPSLVTVVQA